MGLRPVDSSPSVMAFSLLIVAFDARPGFRGRMIKQVILLVPVAAFALACGGSSNKPAGDPSNTSGGAAAAGGEHSKKMGAVCHEIHEACEPMEGKGGVGQQCHDMTYGSTEDACAAKKAECLAACKK